MDKTQADQDLARAGWRALTKRTAPVWAALGIAVVFTIRGWVCPPAALEVPEGLDFQWYGEHCGPGHGTAGEPVDELDAACARHDAAYREQSH